MEYELGVGRSGFLTKTLESFRPSNAIKKPSAKIPKRRTPISIFCQLALITLSILKTIIH
jgi:hypothetical protein